MKKKIALVTTPLLAFAGTVMAQEGSATEQAIQSAAAQGQSVVGVAVAAVIGIAALVMGVGIVLRLIGR